MRGGRSAVGGVAASLWLAGCAARPPASQFPNAEAALGRLKAAGRCGTSLQADAKIDHFGKEGRVRGELLLFADAPARVRMDVVSPFGATLATLTSDGTRFALADLRDRRFYVGAATACNLARLTTVPVPAHVLVDLLRGDAPLLKRTAEPTIAWSGHGYYVVRIASTRGAREEIDLAPRSDDFDRPWSEQRLQLVGVEVEQNGGVLYRARLEDHRAAHTAAPRVDPDHVEPDVPSGPPCDADIPRRIHVEVPSDRADVLFRYDKVEWNPPLLEHTFEQAPPAGMETVPVTCE